MIQWKVFEETLFFFITIIVDYEYREYQMYIVG